MIKVLEKGGQKRTDPDLIQGIQEKFISNYFQNGEKFEVIPLKSGMRQGCPLTYLAPSPTFMTRVLLSSKNWEIFGQKEMPRE